MFDRQLAALSRRLLSITEDSQKTQDEGLSLSSVFGCRPKRFDTSITFEKLNARDRVTNSVPPRPLAFIFQTKHLHQTLNKLQLLLGAFKGLNKPEFINTIKLIALRLSLYQIN